MNKDEVYKKWIKDYSWESVGDFATDHFENALASVTTDGEFTGIIRITVEYFPDVGENPDAPYF